VSLHQVLTSAAYLRCIASTTSLRTSGLPDARI